MEANVCKSCGKELTKDNTSKAYKNLCKDCYAAMVRNRRQQIGKRNLKPNVSDTAPDWERVRIEAAIEITAAVVSVPQRITLDDYHKQRYPILRFENEEIVSKAVELADMLVEKLKGGKA